MANRPSTAQILAAARASNGKRGGASTATLEPVPRAVADKPAESDGEQSHAVDKSTAADVASLSEPAKAEAKPTSVASLVANVRQPAAETNPSATAPPNMAAILKHVRGHRASDPVVPSSIACILAEVRGIAPHTVRSVTSATTIVSGNRAPGEAKSGEVPSKRRGTAEILEAARRQDAGKTATKLAKSQPESAKARPTGTAAILAAARKQGATAGAAVPTAKARVSRVGTEKSAPVTIKNSARSDSAIDGADPAENRPRPARIAEILARVRCEPAQELSPLELPPLIEMVAALRQQADQRIVERRGRADQGRHHWTARLRNWFGGRGDHIAVRQFDHS